LDGRELVFDLARKKARLVWTGRDLIWFGWEESWFGQERILVWFGWKTACLVWMVRWLLWLDGKKAVWPDRKRTCLV
jgi:hypothetical protein